MSQEAALVFSIIIPARNEERVIDKCLQAVVDLDFPLETIEVIVVDNGSQDHTTEIVQSWAGRLSVQVLSKTEGTIGSLRNYGTTRAKGEYLAFLDADCLVPRNWLRDGLAIFESGDRGVVGGFYANPPEASWVADVWCGEEVESKKGDVSYLPSGNLMIRRKDLIAIGGFDESIVTNEDYELCQRVLAAGLSVRCYRNLAVVHLGVPNSLAHFYRKQRWHGTHVMRVFLRDLPKLRNFKSVAFAVYTLVCLAMITIGLPVVLLTGWWGIAAAGLAGLLIAPLALAAGKLRVTGRADHLFPFAILFLAFGMARAMCLLDATLRLPPQRSAKAA